MGAETVRGLSSLTAPLSGASQLCRLGAKALGAGYRDKTFSPLDVARDTLARAEAVQPLFNAFTLIDHDGASEAALASQERWRRGAPLSAIDGVPVTIKDIVHVKDRDIFYGSAAMASVRAGKDAPAVARLRAAGAVIIGLTTTPEFGWKALTDSSRFGITRNPHDATKTPGGSSGGAAVAAACGAGVLHLGTDGGGSIRIPASFTGICGLKPTFGVVPAFPQSAFGTVAHLGPMARTIEDCAAMLMAMGGRDAADWLQPPFGELLPKPQRFVLNGASIGLWDKPPAGPCDADVMATFTGVAARLEKAGAKLDTVTLPPEDLFDLFIRHWYAGAANRLRDVPDEQHQLIDPGFLDIAAQGARYSAADLMAAANRRASFGAGMDALLTKHDIIVSPATGIPAFEAGAEVPSHSGLTRWIEWAGFSYPVNLSQQPAAVIPCGMTEAGLPIGLQIIGPRGADGKALAAASEISAVLSDP